MSRSQDKRKNMEEANILLNKRVEESKTVKPEPKRDTTKKDSLFNTLMTQLKMEKF